MGIANDRATMASLEGCASPPGRELVWTEIAGGGHGIWGGIYDGTAGLDVYAWMLRHRRP